MTPLRYADLAHNEPTLLALTGLKPTEFEALCLPFDHAYQALVRTRTLDGKPRQRQRHSPKNAALPTSEDKLLFVLYYLKTNPLQEVLGATFSMRQPHACVRLKLLLPVLEEALGRSGALPHRHGSQLARAVAGCRQLLVGSPLLIDGTERPVGRAMDEQGQREHYSGKKNGIR